MLGRKAQKRTEMARKSEVLLAFVAALLLLGRQALAKSLYNQRRITRNANDLKRAAVDHDIANSPISSQPASDTDTEIRMFISHFLGSRIALDGLSSLERCKLRHLRAGDILVSQGDFDNIELVLTAAGLNFTAVPPSFVVDENLLQPCRTLFINSESSLLRAAMTHKNGTSGKLLGRQLKRFVRAGGVVVTTDWAVSIFNRFYRFSPARACSNPRVEVAHAHQVRLETVRPSSRRTRCQTSGLIEVVEKVGNLLERLSVPPLWHLLRHPLYSKVASFGGERCQASSKKPSCLLRSDDLLMADGLDCILFCEDLRKGSYFHFVGPLAQSRQVTENGQHPLTAFHLHALSMLSKYEKNQLMSLLNGTHISIEEIGSAAISSSMVLRLVLKSFLPACSSVPPSCGGPATAAADFVTPEPSAIGVSPVERPRLVEDIVSIP